jgi:RsiW-degrading membrane proteinase PrsW (M82 family)
MELNLKTIIVFILAIIPAVVWLYLFLKKHHEGKIMVVLVFIGGMIAAKLILIYQGYWDDTINVIFFKVNPVDFRANLQNIFSNNPFLALFLSFVGVGVMEEFLKFWIMKAISHRFFKSIDDVIQFAIICALGFAFYENIVYFSSQWDKLATGSFFAFALFRVTIVTMVHVLCSGILGYYFGMAFFASPMLKIQYVKQNRHPVLNFFKNTLHIKVSDIYHTQMLIIGLVFSMVLHAIYDFVLTINVSVLGLPLHIPIMLLYFFGGFWLLNRLIDIKDHNLKLGLVGTDIMPKKDFVELLDRIQAIKEKMSEETSESVKV